MRSSIVSTIQESYSGWVSFGITPAWYKKYHPLFPNYTSAFISSLNCLCQRDHDVIPEAETIPSKCVKTHQSLTGLVHRWRMLSRSSRDVYFHYNALKRFSFVLIDISVYLRSTKWNARLILACGFRDLVALCKVIFWKIHIPEKKPKWLPRLIFLQGLVTASKLVRN